MGHGQYFPNGNIENCPINMAEFTTVGVTFAPLKPLRMLVNQGLEQLHNCNIFPFTTASMC